MRYELGRIMAFICMLGIPVNILLRDYLQSSGLSLSGAENLLFLLFLFLSLLLSPLLPVYIGYLLRSLPSYTPVDRQFHQLGTVLFLGYGLTTIFMLTILFWEVLRLVLLAVPTSSIATPGTLFLLILMILVGLSMLTIYQAVQLKPETRVGKELRRLFILISVNLLLIPGSLYLIVASSPLLPFGFEPNPVWFYLPYPLLAFVIITLLENRSELGEADQDEELLYRIADTTDIQP